MEDGNFEEAVATNALLKMPVFTEAMKALLSGEEPLDDKPEDTNFLDKWLANELNRLVLECKNYYVTMYYREALRTGWFEFCAAFDQYRDVCKAGKRKLNKALVMRYLEWQMIIFSPIAPHFCEHGWSLLGKTGSVLTSRWPEPTKPVDSLIVSQGDYMLNKVPHDFIKLLEKASKNGKPEQATVYVAKRYPDWKVKVLSKLREYHSKSALPLVTPDEMKSNDKAKEQWKAVMTDILSDASLKPFGKHLGPFAAFKRDEAAALGDSALSDESPFDEWALISEFVEYLQDKLGLKVDVASSESPAAPEHKDAATTAQPGKPAVYFAAPPKGAAAPKSKAAGKAAGKAAPKAEGKKAPAAAKAAPAAPAAAKPSPSGGSFSVLKDLKALNEHLSTRSYVAGGYCPSSGDATQFDATPEIVSAEQYPHVARWRRHILSFSPEQRGKW